MIAAKIDFLEGRYSLTHGLDKLLAIAIIQLVALQIQLFKDQLACIEVNPLSKSGYILRTQVVVGKVEKPKLLRTKVVKKLKLLRLSVLQLNLDLVSSQPISLQIEDLSCFEVSERF